MAAVPHSRGFSLPSICAVASAASGQLGAHFRRTSGTGYPSGKTGAFAIATVSAFISCKLRSCSGHQRLARRITAMAATQVDAHLNARIEEMIVLNPVIIFSKETCPFCDKAKNALKGSGLNFEVVELDNLRGGMDEKVMDVLAAITGGRTVPRVFIGGKFIGGGDDTAALAASGELKKLGSDAIGAYKQSLEGKGSFQFEKSSDEWRSMLDDKTFRILRQRGTEGPRSHAYDKFLPKVGHFSCAGCELPLYSATSKFASSCGWPVFNKCYSSELGQHVLGRPDGTGSLEIVCTRCGGHLGHVFYDAESAENPNGERH